MPGATLRVYADLLPASDGTAPFAIHTFNAITGGATILPRQAAIANDHFVFTGREPDQRQVDIGKAFAERHGIEAPYYATPGDGIFHFYFPEQGLICAGTAHARRRFTQPRLRRIRRRRDRRRLDDAGVRVGDGLCLRDGSAGAARDVHGTSAAVGQRQGHRPRAAEALGSGAGPGHVGRARRRVARNSRWSIATPSPT